MTLLLFVCLCVGVCLCVRTRVWGVCVAHVNMSRCVFFPSLFVGLNIKEVAHDYATSVSDYITNQLQLLNLYDTWHGKHYIYIM